MVRTGERRHVGRCLAEGAVQLAPLALGHGAGHLGFAGPSLHPRLQPLIEHLSTSTCQRASTWAVTSIATSITPSTAPAA